MTLPARKKAHVISAFDDAGTGESFAADDTPMIEAGAFANYEAAGLVRAAPAERKPRTPAKPKAPATRRSASRRGPNATGQATAGGASKPEDGEPPAPDQTADTE